MSPAKGRRKPIPHRRERREVLKAVAGAGSVLVLTAFATWALRPGPASRFDHGGGGIFNRQPRVTWLFVLAIAALVGFGWWFMKGHSRPRHRRPAWLSGGLVLIVVVALVAGLMWPGGLLRTYQPALDPADFSDPTATTGFPLDTAVPSETLPPETLPPETLPVDPSATVPATPSVTETTAAP